MNIKKDHSSNNSKSHPISVLVIEDSEDDVLLVICELRKGGYNPVYEQVKTASAMKKALKEKEWDIILCDYSLPKLKYLSAIDLLKETNVDIPIIIVSGNIGEEKAIECMHMGAQDYIMKSNLSRLCPAIAREIEEKNVRNKQKQAESQKEAALELLHQSEGKYRTILEDIQEGYFEVDLAGNFAFFNDTLCRVSRDELMGTNNRQYSDKDELKKLYQAYNKIYMTGEPNKELVWKIRRKDGMTRYIEGSISLLKDSSGKPTGFRGIAHDITDRVQIEKKLQEEEQRFRVLTEQSSDIILLVNRKGIITYENKAVEEVLGYSRQERIGSSSLDNIHPDDLKFILNEFDKLWKDINAPVLRNEIRLRHKDGSWRIFEEMASGLLKDNIVESVIINLRDITERKQIEETLRKSELMFRSLFTNNPVGIFLLKDRTFVEVNPAFCNIIGYTAEELIGKPVRIGYANDEEYVRAGRTLYKQVAKKGLGITEARLKRKDGEIFEGLLYLSPIDPQDSSLGYEGIIIDITERKRAEEALSKSERYFKEITENSSDIIVISDEKGNIKYCSPSIERFAGYKPEEVIGKSGFIFIHPDEIRRAFDDFDKFILEKDFSLSYNSFRVVHKDGSERYFYGMGKNLLDNPDIAGIVMNILDITEQKQAEEALKKSEAKYRNIFENAMEGIYQVTPEGKFITANVTLARMAGYDSPEDFIESIKDIKSQLYVHPEDRDKFLKIMKTKDLVEDFEVEFYRKDRSIFWVVLNARMVRDERGKFLYNEGLIEDITLRKQAEEKLKQSLERLKKAVSTTIQVLVSALEVRDPYTAGHQSRSADLACAIAAEMGLSQEQTDGIRMAGIIHDIGKMSIPVEILSKPTKLTSLEFSLIKEHSRSGYEMLKDVEPSWPLAEIVYQHHERLNGTGYPRNLKGDEILIEARILCVADVVEAMASHRPYRASLGIEAALEEVEKNKGILYDENVVNVCLRLFRDKGYTLE
jgi:PAS domain S-box-containing protein